MIGNMFASARYARVLRLLDLERRMILNGPLAGLKALVDQRETAVTDILTNETDLPEAFLMALKARAERNSRLLLASLAGVRSGATLAEEARDAAGRLRTYSASGEPVQVQAPRVTRDQRA